MKIGLSLPSILMADRFNDRIFAPKNLFLKLADGLVEENVEINVYSSSNTKTKAQLVSINSTIEEKDLFSIRDIRKEASKINELSIIRNAYEYELALLEHSFAHGKKEKIDLLHIYLMPHGNYTYDFLDFPIAITLHDAVPPQGSIERTRFQPMSKIYYIAISDLQKKQYEDKLGIKIFTRIYHGIDSNSYTYQENPTADYFVTIGRYIPEKGIPDAIQACIKTKNKLKIASSKNYRDIEYYHDKIYPLLGSEYVQEYDFFEKGNKIDFLANAKAFLFPINWEEPFGMVMLEAMSVGTPVIAYAQGSVPEIIKDGETGFIINSSDKDIRGEWIIKKTGIEGLTEAIEKIKSMPENEYTIMRQKSRKHIEENFTLERMVNEYKKAYKKILEN